MTDVGGTTNTKEAQSRNIINICTEYGFDSLIISGRYGGHRQHTTDNARVWHKLPTDELKIVFIRSDEFTF